MINQFTGRTYGYARVSTGGQNLDRQIEALLEYGLDERDIIKEKKSGKDFDRPAYIYLKETLLRWGDTLVIKELDRLGRNYDEMKEEWNYLCTHGIDIVIIDMPILSTRGKSDLDKKFLGNIVFEIMAYIAERERAINKQRQAEGIAAAKAKGKHLGRKKAVMPSNFGLVFDEWQSNQISALQAMKKLGLKNSTFYKFARAYKPDYERKPLTWMRRTNA